MMWHTQVLGEQKGFLMPKFSSSELKEKMAEGAAFYIEGTYVTSSYTYVTSSYTYVKEKMAEGAAFYIEGTIHMPYMYALYVCLICMKMAEGAAFYIEGTIVREHIL